MGARLLAVALGGALGAVLRYLAGLGAQRLWGEHFPWGTLLVNLTGCLLLGGLLAWSSERAALPESVRLFGAVGVCGAFTTFSTFGHETVELLRRDQLPLALAYAGASVLLGLLAVLAGRAAVLAWP